MLPPLRLRLEVLAIVRLAPAANVPATRLTVPPLAMVLALSSVTVLPGLLIVRTPVRLVGSKVPMFCVPVPSNV